MKAKKNDATHWQSKHKEHWLCEYGCWYLLCNGYWQRAKPDFNGMEILKDEKVDIYEH